MAQGNKSRSLWIRKESYPSLFHARAWLTGLGLVGLVAGGALLVSPLLMESQVERAARVRLASLGFELQSARVEGQDLELWVKSGPGNKQQVEQVAQALAQTSKCDVLGVKLPCVEQAQVHLAPGFEAQAPGASESSSGRVAKALPTEPTAPDKVVARPKPSAGKAPIQVAPVPNANAAERSAQARCQAELSALMAQDSIRFKTASTRLLKESYKHIEKLAKAAVDCPGFILVIGHTDNVGKARSNEWLSRVRARAVRRVMIAHGLPEQKVIAQGKGSSEPLVSNDTADGRAKNRRIEFRVVLSAPSTQESLGQ